MKLKIRLEREGLYFLLVVLLVGFVIATGGGNPDVYHEATYTDTIMPHSGGSIKLESPTSTHAAKLDFVNTANDYWSVMYKTNNDNPRFLFTYYNGTNWKEAGYFDTDGDLHLNGNICLVTDSNFLTLITNK